jgi:hypothetical protein
VGRERVAAVLGGVLMAALSCSSPDYRFRSNVDSGTTTTNLPPPDSGTEAGPADAGESHDADASGAPPIEPLVLPAGDIGDVCRAVNVYRVYPFMCDDGTRRHCHLFFANEPYRRSWPDANAACARISRADPPRLGHLATLSKMEEAMGVQNYFQGGQIPWIGLLLTPGAPPTDKASFTWITGEPVTHDGWAAGTPAGEACVAYSGGGQWSDVACDVARGFLCEIDE